jgi:hypothetical protein
LKVKARIIEGLTTARGMQNVATADKVAESIIKGTLSAAGKAHDASANQPLTQATVSQA